MQQKFSTRFVSGMRVDFSNKFLIQIPTGTRCSFGGNGGILQKTQMPDEKTASQKEWNELRVKKLYDENYDKILKDNPQALELNFKKPKIYYSPNEENGFASYNVFSNEIDVYADLSEDFYIYPKFDQNGGLVDISGPVYKDDMQTGGIKLTEEEKELYTKSAIVHEIRHCVQTHLALSIEGGEDYRDYLKKQNYKIAQAVRLYQQMGGDLSKLGAMGRISGYAASYSPKKILDKNTGLKFSMLPEDGRYWSVKEHFSKPKSKIDPSCLPQEIDAHNYQAEYLLREGKGAKGVRGEVLNYMATRLCLSCKKPEDVEKYGYPPVILCNPNGDIS